MDEFYGAAAELGEVVEVARGGRYRVKSLTREGITTPPIPALPDKILDMTGADARPLHTGDAVYFFMFDDGAGMVLWPKN